MWNHTMIGPDGARYPNAARYEEIVEGQRIVYTNGGGREGAGKGVHFRAIVTFVAKGDKTELTLRSVFDTPAERDMVVREYGAVEGGNQTLSRLAAHVAGDFLVARQVDAPAKLVFINAFSDKDGGLGRHPLAPTWPAQMMTTVLFADFGPKTLITLQWSPYEANAVERKTFSEGMAGMNQGWSGTFERLDAYLEESR